ncbi:MAG: hypothetical protein ACREQ4_05810 [Candidatus Binataceae bacterium]
MVERGALPLFLSLGLIASFLLAVGLLLMKSCAGRLPVATGRGMLWAVVRWLREPMWLGGLALQASGYALSVVAMAGAPVSLVSVTMQGGIALFVVFAVIFLHERARPLEWLGIGGIIVAIVMLAVSLDSGAMQGAIAIPSMEGFSVGAVLVAFIPYLSVRLRDNGIATAIASGIAFGAGGIYTKAMTYLFAGALDATIALRVLSSPYIYLIIVTNIIGIVLLQNSFHVARGLIVMPISSALSNIMPILGGIIIFGETLPSQPFDAAMRAAAFALTIAASALLATTREEVGVIQDKAEVAG